MKKTANVIGATGMVGRELVSQLLKSDSIEKVRIFVRRDLQIRHPKLEQHMIDFNNAQSWEPLLQGDILFSTLGTTIRQAGSKKNQYLVDYSYQYRFAEKAAKNGIPSYVLVSAAGADPKSLIFYARMKGELDEAVLKLPFKKIAILRPSILEGDREKRRVTEEWSVRIMKWLTRFVFSRYRPVASNVVARAMIRIALEDQILKSAIVDPGDIFNLAGK